MTKDLSIGQPESSNKKPEKYKFKVKETVYETDKQEITGREICEIADLKPPESYKLDMKTKGNIYKEVKLDEPIDLSEPGIEKFTYIKRDQYEG